MTFFQLMPQFGRFGTSKAPSTQFSNPAAPNMRVVNRMSKTEPKLVVRLSSRWGTRPPTNSAAPTHKPETASPAHTSPTPIQSWRQTTGERLSTPDTRAAQINALAKEHTTKPPSVFSPSNFGPPKIAPPVAARGSDSVTQTIPKVADRDGNKKAQRKNPSKK
mmetsp:Transcript_8962/g.24993  ORF Transcript_8962/g.24993 Transcript_8962/m.24993 type:complete len:163 (-) Transcript_8962:541-1029(-)